MGTPSGAGYRPKNVNHPDNFSLTLPGTGYGWGVAAAKRAGGRGQKYCWAGGGTKYVPARPVGISLSARAKPGAGAAPHPSNTEGSPERLLHVPPSLTPWAQILLPSPLSRGGLAGAGGGEADLKSLSLYPPNPREFPKRPVSQESPCPKHRTQNPSLASSEPRVNHSPHLSPTKQYHPSLSARPKGQ